MEASLKLGNGDWGVKNDSLLAYDDFGGKFRPLPFDFTRASSATVVNKQGLIETVQSGIPRIDFSNDANGALLLEPQSTNYISYSEGFNQWTIGGSVVVTDNQVISPDGTLNASILDFTSAVSSGNGVYRFTGDRTGSLSRSIYLKGASGGESVRLSDPHMGGGSNVTLTTEWKRFEYISTAENTNAGIWLRDSIGNVIHAYGAQLEQSSYPTSYIPTQGAISTRLAETCSGGGSDQVINSTEGTIYGEFSNTENDTNSNRVNLSDGTVFNWVFIGKDGVNVRAYLRANNITVLSNKTTPLASINKVALSYKSGNIKVYINGVQIISSTDVFSFTAPLNQMNFGTFNGQGTTTKASWKSAQLYNTALTDAELIALTTI